jgi:septal ring-binding cell division protein DamX
MVEVLQAEASLYNAEKSYAQDQYDYLLQVLTLKEAEGTLGIDEIVKINSWLEEKSVERDYSQKEISNNMDLNENSSAINDSEQNQVKTKPVKDSAQVEAQPKGVLVHGAQKNQGSAKTPNAMRKNSGYYLKANPNNFTVRLLITNNEANAQKFIANYKLKTAHYLTTDFSGQKRFILTDGNYTNFASAKQIENKWIKILKSTDVTTINFAMLQNMMK